MGNPHPKNNLQHATRQDDTTEQLSSLTLGARLPVSIDAAVRSLPNRSAWLRRVITEAAQRELLNTEESSTT
jgi:hypothetical protein